MMPAVGKMLIILGVIIILAGVLLFLADKIPHRRLPATSSSQGRTALLLPASSTSIIISLVLSLIFWIFRK